MTNSLAPILLTNENQFKESRAEIQKLYEVDFEEIFGSEMIYKPMCSRDEEIDTYLILCKHGRSVRKCSVRKYPSSKDSSFSSLLRSSTVKRIFDNCDTYLGFVDTGTFRNRHGIHLRTPKSEDLDYFESLLAAKIEAYGSSKDYLEYVSIRELAESIQNSKARIFK